MALTPHQIQGIIDVHRQRASSIDYPKWDQYRSWYAGNFWNTGDPQPHGSGEVASTNDEDLTFEQNYAFAFTETMISNIVPTNPQVTVSARNRKKKDEAKIREALINDSFTRLKMHKVLWTMATHAAIYGRGFRKAVWNIRRGQPDVINIDPRHIFFDMSASRWDDIRYICEVTVLTKEDFEKRTKPGKNGKKPVYDLSAAEGVQYGAYPVWLNDKVQDKSMINDASKDVFQWVLVYEFYDFSSDKYYHFLGDSPKPLLDTELPYRVVRNPFGMLTFNDNLVDIGGMSDIQLIANSQERLNEIDTLELLHAHSSIPVLMLHKGLVDNPSEIMTAYRDASEPGAILSISAKPEVPIGHLWDVTPSPTLNPSFDKMRERCIQSIEFTLALAQYQRGAVGITDVATEIALADQASRTRNSRRQKEVFDQEGEMSVAIMGLYEEFLSPDSLVPVRVSGTQKAMEISREFLGVRSQDQLSYEEPLEYDYDAVPYSPAENNRVLQIRNLQDNMQYLMTSPFVDQQKLANKLLETLMISDVLMDDEQLKAQAEQQAAQAAQMGAAGGAGGGPAPLGQDTTAGGGMPPGVADVPGVPGVAGGPGAVTGGT